MSAPHAGSAAVRIVAVLAACLVGALAVAQAAAQVTTPVPPDPSGSALDPSRSARDTTPGAARRPRTPLVLEGAYSQVGVTTIYDPRYTTLPYPGGDVPVERGVCCDVIVRAYRRAGLDLQRLVHEDMLRSFASYPPNWGLTKPDPNIDHRRVPNLATFFTRHGTKLPVSARAADYRPGDIVTWRLPVTGAAHIGLVSDRVEDDRPLIVHNVGDGARVEDVLFAYTVTGHYRYDP